MLHRHRRCIGVNGCQVPRQDKCEQPLGVVSLGRCNFADSLIQKCCSSAPEPRIEVAIHTYQQISLLNKVDIDIRPRVVGACLASDYIPDSHKGHPYCRAEKCGVDGTAIEYRVVMCKRLAHPCWMRREQRCCVSGVYLGDSQCESHFATISAFISFIRPSM